MQATLLAKISFVPVNIIKVCMSNLYLYMRRVHKVGLGENRMLLLVHICFQTLHDMKNANTVMYVSPNKWCTMNSYYLLHKIMFLFLLCCSSNCLHTRSRYRAHTPSYESKLNFLFLYRVLSGEDIEPSIQTTLLIKRSF